MTLTRLAVVFLACAATLLPSCATEDGHRSADRSTAGRMNEDPMHGIMRKKLVHTQAIVEGIAISDYDAVAHHAESLVRLSEQGSWMVHDTMAYVAFSDDFRNTARTLGRDARREQSGRVVEHYSDLIRTCVACHDYLRREQLIKDMPGRVSLADLRAFRDELRSR